MIEVNFSVLPKLLEPLAVGLELALPNKYPLFLNEEKRCHEEYQNAIKSRKSLNKLVDLALETWLKTL